MIVHKKLIKFKNKHSKQMTRSKKPSFYKVIINAIRAKIQVKQKTNFNSRKRGLSK